jgi:hypothetical protein
MSGLATSQALTETMSSDWRIILLCEGVVRRREFLSGLGSTVVLVLVFVTAKNTSTQSVVQGPHCTGVIHGIVSVREGHFSAYSQCIVGVALAMVCTLAM